MRFFIVILITAVLIPLSEILYFKFAPDKSFISITKYLVADWCVGEKLNNDIELTSKNNYNVRQTIQLLKRNWKTRTIDSTQSEEILIMLENKNNNIAHIKREQEPVIDMAWSYKAIILRDLYLPYNNKKTITGESNEFVIKDCSK